MTSTDAQRSPLAMPVDQMPPGPNLATMTENPATSEPGSLERFRESEDAILTTYGWVDKNAKIMRIPISEAKRLILERGIPGGTVTPPKPAKTGPGGS